ncbi:hypothetical protein NUSPORA_00654 [Nucleospora cyclopteri]
MLANLKAYKKRTNCRHIESSRFYHNLSQNITSLLNIKNPLESSKKMSNFLEISRMFDNLECNKDAENHYKLIPSLFLNHGNFINKKLFFVEELRRILLYEIKVCNKKEFSHTYKTMHMYLHLIQLYLTPEISLFEKINEFLNINFKLHEGDLIGNAIRGNFGKVVEISPDLREAVEKFSCDSKLTNFSLNAWKNQYKIPSVVFNIFSGCFKDFSSVLELVCYKLKYEENFNVNNYKNNCVLLDLLLNGNINFIINGDFDNSLKLVLALVNPKELEFSCYKFVDLFEKVFMEVDSLDFHIALPFLSFTPRKELFYNMALKRVNLENMNINQILHFATQNVFDTKNTIDIYSYFLQENKLYHSLILFLINNHICGFNYSKESLNYFIDNFDNFSFLINYDFLKDETNLFIYEVGNIQNADEKTFKRLLNHQKFTWCIDRIIRELSRIKNKDLLLLALKKIIEADSTGIPYNLSFKKIIITSLGQ